MRSTLLRLTHTGIPTVLRATVYGGMGGLAFGSLLLLIGLGRFALALLGGRSSEPITTHDLQLMAWYVAGFGMAGSFVGAVRALWSSAVAITGALALGGTIVMNTIAIADQGYAAWRASNDWIAMSILGAVFGFAAAYGWLRAKAAIDAS